MTEPKSDDTFQPWRKFKPDVDDTPYGWIQWKGTAVCLAHKWGGLDMCTCCSCAHKWTTVHMARERSGP